MARIIRVSVREQVIERQTIELEIPDNTNLGSKDLEDEEALNAFLEQAFVEGAYRVVPNTKEVAVEERDFFKPELAGNAA